MTDEPQQLDTPPKPKRRRWRWLAVGMLLFVVSGAGWWHWPRGDVRFIGKWEVSYGGAAPWVHWQFFPNGTGYVSQLDGTVACSLPWRVKGDTLALGNPENAVTRLRAAISPWIFRQTGFYLFRPESEVRYPILVVERHRISLSQGARPSLTLIRLHD
jgi:hypothetical protein